MFDNRNFSLIDYLTVTFKISPAMVILRILDKLIHAFMPTVQMLATAAFVDTAIAIFNGQAVVGDIYPALIILGAIAFYAHSGKTFMTYVVDWHNIQFSKVIEPAVLNKRARLEYRHIEDNDSWELINRVSRRPAHDFSLGLDLVVRMADMVLRVGLIMYVLATQVWWAALVITLFSAPLFWASIKAGRVNYQANVEARKHTRRADYLHQVLASRENVEERALYGYTEEVNKRWYSQYESARKMENAAEKYRQVRTGLSAGITVLICTAIAGVLVIPLARGTISIGMFIGMFNAAYSLVQTMSWELAYLTGELTYKREFLKDLTAFFKLSETPGALDAPDDAVREEPARAIEFRNVSFRYPGTERYILKNLSLRLEPHRHYAFVGVNGAGKTTVTKLLTGLYDNYEGDIFYGETNLRQMTQAQLKGLFSVVYQDFARYFISMEENIALGNVNHADERRMREVVNLVGLDAAAAELPRGLKTDLGKIRPDGTDISGGQWQRVALARALMSTAPIRILDEPTAALDPVAESRIYEMFGDISRGHSTVFITHRLGAARLADEILVIDEGCVAQQGNHDELMAQGGLYARMFEAQRSWYL